MHELGSARYEELIPAGERLPGSRAVIEVEIHKVGSVSLPILHWAPKLISRLGQSCGYSVPLYEWKEDRTLLVNRMATREQRDAEICSEEAKNGASRHFLEASTIWKVMSD